MFWLFLALLSAIFIALKNVITRRLVSLIDRNVILYTGYLFPALFAILLIFFAGIPEIKPAFYYSIIIASIIDIIAMTFFLKAIASGELAKTFPLVAFTPVFLIATSFLILGETTSIIGLSGILAISLGAYLLRSESVRVGILEPLKLLLREKGSRYMLITAFLFSLIGPLFKKAILNSSPFFALATTEFLGTLLLILFFLPQKKICTIHKKIASNFKLLFLQSIAIFFAALALFAALNFSIPAVYVISIKRTSILFTIILGFILFKEKNFARNLIAGTIIILGIFLISLG